MKVVISRGFLLVSGLLHMSRVCTGERIMAAWRRAMELSLGDSDTAKLRSIAQSRTEPASRVERARILLAYREDPSFFAVSRALGLHHQTVQRCVERAVAEGAMAALDDRPGPGRLQGEGPWLSPRIVDDPASRPPRSRAWTGAGTCVSRQSGAGHGVQDPRPGRGETAQSAILPGTTRSRLCGKDGRGAVRLSPGENPQAGGDRVKGEEKAYRRGGDHLLRREAGYPGDRDDRPGFAARARRPRDLRTGA